MWIWQVRTQSFFDASVKLTYNFKLFNRVNLDVSAGVSNIFNSYQNDFDSGVNRDLRYIYGPALPDASTPESPSAYKSPLTS